MAHKTLSNMQITATYTGWANRLKWHVIKWKIPDHTNRAIGYDGQFRKQSAQTIAAKKIASSFQHKHRSLQQSTLMI